MQCKILLLASALTLVQGQVPTYQCPPDPPASTTASPDDTTTTAAPPTTPPAQPTYQCPDDTTTTAAPPDDTTTTAAPPTTPPAQPTYQCPDDTTTTAAPPDDTTTTAAPPDDTTTTAAPPTTSSPTTTSSPPSDSCVYPASCDKNVKVDNADFSPESTPVYDQIITSGGDHLNYDNECSTWFKSGNGTYIFIRSVIFEDGSHEIKRFVYSEINGYPGVYRGQGLNGNDACDTCVFNDYYLGQPCNGTWVLQRCYIFGDCVDEYSGSTYIVFSSTPFISNECYGPIQDLIGTNYTTLPRKYNKKCVTRIGGLDAINAGSVENVDSYEIEE